MKITVKALANVMGMQRGQRYVLDADDIVDGLIDKGFLVWLDAPEPDELDLTPVVLERVAQVLAAEVEKRQESDDERSGEPEAETP